MRRLNSCAPLVGLVSLCILCACSCVGTGPRNSVVKDLPPDSISNVRSTGPETPDLLSCADDLARDLLGVPKIAGATPYCRMALREVKNFSSFRFDPEIISDKLRSVLINKSQGKIRFVQRTRGGEFAEFDTAVMGEREMKREGVVDSGQKKPLAGVDFFLTGTVRSHTVVTGGGRDDATFISFILEDAETGEIAWERSYGPIRKVAEKSILYRTVK